MMNLTNSKKAVIVKVDTGSYHSFNAYVRPKRVKSDYRRHPNARVINLDPTNNPEEVCNAYRDIQIKAQLRRIAKNEQRLADRRRLAEEAAAAAKAKAELIALKRAKAQQLYRQSSVVTMRRKALLKDINNNKFLLVPEQASMRNAAFVDIADLRRTQKIDVVSITSAGVVKADGAITLSLWGMDNFERPPQSLYSRKPITSRAEVKRAVRAVLDKGYLMQLKDINGAVSSVKGAIAALRKEGVMVCTVRNSEVDAQARGWIIPSATNGITDSAFIKMAKA